MVLRDKCNDRGLLVGENELGEEYSLEEMGGARKEEGCGGSRISRIGNFQHNTPYEDGR